MLIVLKGKGIVGCYGNKRRSIRKQWRLVKLKKDAHVETQMHVLGDRRELSLTPLLSDSSILWCSAERYKDKVELIMETITPEDESLQLGN